MNEYTHPEVLVSTEWVAEHRCDPNIRLVEVNEDQKLYYTGHIEDAVHWHPDWRDYLNREYLIGRRMAFLSARLLGIQEGTTVVFYGADHNWWAGFAFWLFKRFGHADCRIMDGGREKWIAEGRPLSADIPEYENTTYHLGMTKTDETHLRAKAEDVIMHIQQGKPIVDVRSLDEYAGKVVFAPSAFQDMLYPERGHIPTAAHFHWKKALNPDGTFKSVADLRTAFQKANIDLDEEIITYCSVGERSGHTWFVLNYLLGLPNVRNYDASWVEWGSQPDFPQSTGELPGDVPDSMEI